MQTKLMIRADAAAVFDATAAGRPIVLSPGIEALFKESCQTNANVVSVGGIDYTFVVSFLNSFDAGTATGESSPVTTTADNPYTITESSIIRNFLPDSTLSILQDTNPIVTNTFMEVLLLSVLPYFLSMK